MRSRAADRSSTTAILKRRRATAARISAGASTTSSAYVARTGQARPGGLVHGTAAEQQPGAPEVVGLEVGDRLDGGLGAGDDDRVGGGAEGGGDGRLVAGLHAQQRGHRAHQARHRVRGGEQRTGAVLAVESELERVAAGHQPGPVAIGLLGLLAGLGEAFVDVVEGRDGGFVLRVEALLAGVETGDPGLERREVLLGPRGAGERLLAGRLEATDLVGRRGRPRLQCVDLAVQPRESFATVGGGADQPGDAALLLCRGVLRRTPNADGGLESGAVLLDQRRDLGLLLAHPRGLGLELVGIAPGVHGVRRRPRRRRCGAARPPATGCRAGVPSGRRGRTTSPGPWPAPGGRCAARPRASSPARGPARARPRPRRDARPGSTRRPSPAPARAGP